jgi:aldehyde:ferredoxin oxidoreductase
VRSGTFNAAGRTGMGGIMGSKNLKAIAVRGPGFVDLARPMDFHELAIEAQRTLRESCPTDVRDALARWEHHLISDVSMYEECENVSFGTLESPGYPPELLGIKKLRLEFARKYPVKSTACFGCPTPCQVFFNVPGIGAASTYCEAWQNFPTTTKVASQEANWKWYILCQEFGMDTISLSNVLGFAMDLYQRGIITKKETDGIPLEYGNEDAAIAMTEKIAKREGFGNVLAEGVRRAAAKIGNGAEYYAHHVKGLEMYRADPRGWKGKAIQEAVEYKAFSGLNVYEYRKLKTNTHEYEEPSENRLKMLKERYGTSKVCYPHEYEGKHFVTIDAEDIRMTFDILSICADPYLTHDYDQIYATMAPLVSAATGKEIGAKALREYAKKSRTLLRALDAREGFGRKNDVLPERLFEVPIPRGRHHRGLLVDRKKFNKMLDNYYAARGWDVKTGIPRREKLEELGLKDVANTLEKIRRTPYDCTQ